jgi:hypothetical protein
MFLDRAIWRTVYRVTVLGHSVFNVLRQVLAWPALRVLHPLRRDCPSASRSNWPSAQRYSMANCGPPRSLVHSIPAEMQPPSAECIARSTIEKPDHRHRRLPRTRRERPRDRRTAERDEGVDHVVIDDHAEPLELTPSTVAFTDTPPSLLFTHSHSPCPAPTRSTLNTATVHSSPATHQRGNTRPTGRDHQTRCSSRRTSSTLTLTIFVELMSTCRTT